MSLSLTILLKLDGGKAEMRKWRKALGKKVCRVILWHTAGSVVLLWTIARSCHTLYCSCHYQVIPILLRSVLSLREAQLFHHHLPWECFSIFDAIIFPPGIPWRAKCCASSVRGLSSLSNLGLIQSHAILLVKLQWDDDDLVSCFRAKSNFVNVTQEVSQFEIHSLLCHNVTL